MDSWFDVFDRIRNQGQSIKNCIRVHDAVQFEESYEHWCWCSCFEFVDSIDDWWWSNESWLHSLSHSLVRTQRPPHPTTHQCRPKSCQATQLLPATNPRHSLLPPFFWAHVYVISHFRHLHSCMYIYLAYFLVDKCIRQPTTMVAACQCHDQYPWFQVPNMFKICFVPLTPRFVKKLKGTLLVHKNHGFWKKSHLDWQFQQKTSSCAIQFGAWNAGFWFCL